MRGEGEGEGRVWLLLGACLLLARLVRIEDRRVLRHALREVRLCRLEPLLDVVLDRVLLLLADKLGREGGRMDGGVRVRVRRGVRV